MSRTKEILTGAYKILENAELCKGQFARTQGGQTMDKLHEVEWVALVRILALLEDKGWCQGTEALTGRGIEVAPEDKNATCFCLLGAINRVCHEHPHLKQLRLVYALRAQTGERDLVRWNDREGRTKDEVMALVRRTLHAVRVLDPQTTHN